MPGEVLLELRTSMFGHLLDLPGCDDCPGGDLCEKPVAIMGDGSTMRHGDPPHPVVWWPCCPWRHESTWSVHGFSGGEQAPASWCEWAIARGVHRQRISAGGAMVLREYLSLRRYPRLVGRAKQWAEVKNGNG